MASAIRLTVANAFVELYLHLILAIIYMSADKDEYVQFCVQSVRFMPRQQIGNRPSVARCWLAKCPGASSETVNSCSK